MNSGLKNLEEEFPCFVHICRCRQSRLDAFVMAFTHISSEIDVIYKELTRSSVHPLGKFLVSFGVLGLKKRVDFRPRALRVKAVWGGGREAGRGRGRIGKGDSRRAARGRG